jgi:amino acid adenylation domain-containing protein
MERMAGRFANLLEAIVSEPGEKVSRLRMLSEAELKEVLYEWNDTSAPFPSHLCLHHLFERQAATSPEATAVECGQAKMTYRELSERSGRLARLLRAKGAGPERAVAICLDRSQEMVVGMLAVLKSGSAYLPLDPAYPRQRLLYMLEDAGACLLLTESKYSQEFGGLAQEVVRIDGRPERMMLDGEGDQDAEAGPEAGGEMGGGGEVWQEAGPENLAYIIYTSGSTGRPKGVPIEHHSAVAMVSWASAYYSPEELSGVLASTSICFDLSVFEVFVPLSVGGRVVVVANALELIGGEAAGVSLINTVPSAMGELVRAGAIGRGVRAVNLAGEALRNRLAQEVYEAGDVGRVINLYGPSEDTTYSTYHEVARGTAKEPSIGRPISNGEVYVLDVEMNPVGVGVVGEIYVSGEGLARGYWERAEMTAERYVPNPYGVKAGARMYRTGDLGRYREGGEVEYVGRADQQVKVRGFRIELGEIEEVMRGCEGVGEVVVDAKGEEKVLVAYVVKEEGKEIRSKEVREYVRGRVPEYMVPGVIMEVEKIPLNANGKIDRKALPSPDKVQPKNQAEYVAPRNIIEEAVAGIWKEILGVQQVSVQDNFFDVGGHSILAMRLLSRLRETFRVQLPVRYFFGAATVAELSQALVANETKPGRTEKIARLLSKVARMSTEELGKILQEGGRKKGPA